MYVYGVSRTFGQHLCDREPWKSQNFSMLKGPKIGERRLDRKEQSVTDMVVPVPCGSHIPMIFSSQNPLGLLAAQENVAS